MPTPDLSALRATLAGALRSAAKARLGVPASLEPLVRDYARSLRLDAMPIEKAIIDVKALTTAEAPGDVGAFMPRVVGWAIAGYFAGTSRSDSAAR
ncbi:MAG: hypothetical protein JWL60_1276 [Gemmatimonadetes bacterium]|jgi:hypothetical protein|nr:hypothetical protein [Gemmatimonadota bacterium]